MSESPTRIVENLEPMKEFDRPDPENIKVFCAWMRLDIFRVGVDESVDNRKAARRRLVSY
jgi:hypothetical protein